MRNKLAIVLGLLLASSVAIAADYPKFDDVDLDGDGALNQTEAAQAGLDIESADTNGDGVIDSDEYQAAVEGDSAEDES